MTDVTIPDNVMPIAGGAFNSCSGLVTVSLPSGITLSSCMFDGCNNLDTASRNAILAINSTAFECVA